MKKKLLVDFDSTIAKSQKAIFEILQKKYKFEGEYTTNYLWDFSGLIPKEYRDEAVELFGKQELYDNLELMENAYDVLEYYSDKFDISICTIHDIETIHMKDDYINKHLPFIKNKIYLPNNGLYDKSSVDGDIIIDDRVSCLKGDREFKILFGNYKYNKMEELNNEDLKIFYEPNLVRANSWLDVKILLDCICILEE